jgi:tungstate transport system ATP-binding protein
MSDLLFDLQQASIYAGNTPLLVDCSLRIRRGERVALVGANGSGKTSLLRHLHGLALASGGQSLRPVAARQAMLFQRPYMLRTSALNNVALGLWLGGQDWKDAKVQARLALEHVGMGALALRPAKTLSGGQQQRLALARAWAVQPEVLLLDEPTASLDPAAKRDVEQLMAEFAASGMTLIFSSHNLGQVKRLASRVLYLEHGRVLADASVVDFFSKALPTAAAQFLQGELV